MLLLVSLLAAVFCVPALAVTESEVESQVAASGKGAVAGNVLIWFLCAIAFLKVSQKIDSFMASLGVNVGRTGGSLLGEAMVAMRAVTMMAGGGHRTGGKPSPGASGSGSNSGWFLKGGIAGAVSRHVTNSAVKTATTQTSAVHTAQSSMRQAAAASQTAASQTAGNTVNNDVHAGGVDIHTSGSLPVGAPAQEGVIVADAGTQNTSINQDLHASGGVPVDGAPAGDMIGPGAVITNNSSVTSDVYSGGVDIHAGGSMPVGASPQEGVIITDAGAQPISQAGPDSPAGSATSVVSSDGAVLNIPQTGDLIPASPVSSPETDLARADDVPTPESISVPDHSEVVSPDGAVLNIPAPGSPIPASAPSPIAPAAHADESAPESVFAPDHSEAVPDSGAVLNIPPAESSIPASPHHEGTAPVASQTENASVQESMSVAEGGTVLNFPAAGSAVPSAPVNVASPQGGVIVTGGERQHTSTQTATSSQSATATRNTQTSSTVERSHTSVTHSRHTQSAPAVLPSLGGMIFSKSLASGGSFANDVIGTVARGEVSGSITGDMAAQSLSSYMGYTAIRETAREVPSYSDVEIGRGRITGVETAAGSTEGVSFAMYHVAQYEAPSGEFQKVYSADGTQWYKQYAQDTVERKPYKAPDDTVAYHEKIVKKMPNPPRRKDRM